MIICGLFFLFNTIENNFIRNENNIKFIFESLHHLIKVFNIIKIFKNNSDSNSTKKYFKIINKIFIDKTLLDLKFAKEFIITKIKINSIDNNYNLATINEFSETLKAFIRNKDEKPNTTFQKILLLLITYKISNNKLTDVIDSKITLDYIMPKNLKFWHNDMREWDNDLKQLTDSEIDKLSKTYINSLGNLLLISDRDNKSLQNKRFVDKKKSINSFRYKNILFSCSDKNIDVSEKNIWTFEMINKREDYLYRLIYEIYYSVFK